jgi:hypothetical protein
MQNDPAKTTTERPTMRFFMIALALTLAGCATKSVSPSQMYRFEGESNGTQIQGVIRQTMTETKFAVIFDGQAVINGFLPSDFNGEVKGETWKGKQVSAVCNGTKSGYKTQFVNCMIFVGNERTVTLTFN